MATSKLRSLFTTEPAGPPLVVSLVYSSKEDKVVSYLHATGKKATISANWLKANMDGQRYWEIALFIESHTPCGHTEFDRTDIKNYRTKGNTCTHEDLQELLVLEHADLIRSTEARGNLIHHLYWIATPNAPYIEDQESLQILEEVFPDE